MRVLVTGINGFIGSYVASKFKNAGYEVIGLDRDYSADGYKVYRINMMQDDISNMLDKERPEIIIHCAGLANVSYSLHHIEEDFNANTVVVYRLLEAMRKNSLQSSRLILMSSAAVYGQPVQLPISENASLNPMSPYALHKKMAEDICRYFIDNYQFDIRILRVFSAFGPGLRKQIFWDMHQKIRDNGKLDLYGTGAESRDYIYIDDLVEAIFLIALDVKSNYIIWNVANGEEVTIREIAEVFAENVGMDSSKINFSNELREGDPINWCADISRLLELGYKKETSIQKGIKQYIAWADKER